MQSVAIQFSNINRPINLDKLCLKDTGVLLNMAVVYKYRDPPFEIQSPDTDDLDIGMYPYCASLYRFIYSAVSKRTAIPQCFQQFCVNRTKQIGRHLCDATLSKNHMKILFILSLKLASIDRKKFTKVMRPYVPTDPSHICISKDPTIDVYADIYDTLDMFVKLLFKGYRISYNYTYKAGENSMCYTDHDLYEFYVKYVVQLDDYKDVVDLLDKFSEPGSRDTRARILRDYLQEYISSKCTRPAGKRNTRLTLTKKL